MGDHGASAIIPVNIVMMFACVLASVLLFLGGRRGIVIVAMVAIRNVARDQYGGMQICLLALPGAMLGIVGLGKLIRDAEMQGSSLTIESILMVTWCLLSDSQSRCFM